MKNNLEYLSTFKKIFITNTNNSLNRKNYNINPNLNYKRVKSKNSETIGFRSTTFSENPTSLNSLYNYKSKLIPKSHLGKKILNKLQSLPFKNYNKISYGTNLNNYYPNKKAKYEPELYDNFLKAEPTSELFICWIAH